MFWNHPFNEHTTVDPETRHDMQGDQVCRTIYLHLAALGLLYRDNLHLGRPRLGQWLIDSFGIAHWIHPRSFAIAMGFPHDFQLPTDDITAYKLLSKSACPPTTAIWLHIAQHAIAMGDCAAFYEAFAAMLFKAIPPQFRDLVTGQAVCHPRSTATHVSCEQLAQCTGVPRRLAEIMLDTTGCEILSAARILLQLGISRLRAGAPDHDVNPAARTLLEAVNASDRKLASNFIRHIDCMQFSLTPALEAIMSQNLDMMSQTGNGILYDTRHSITREVSRLFTITSPTFWQGLERETPATQMRCCRTLSRLCDVAMQRPVIRRLALQSDLQHVQLGGETQGSIASSLDGSAFAASAQAVSITAHILCFAFRTSDFHHGLLTAKHFAIKLGLFTTCRRVLF